MLNMDKETPEDISSVTVGLWRKSRYQFYLCRNKSADIMKERCEVSSKNLRKNFRVKEFFTARNISRYFPMFKRLSYVNTKTR